MWGRGKRGRRTTRPSRAHGPIAGVLGVAAAVADLGVQQALVLELLAEGVLDAPEAAGGDGALFDVVRHRGSGVLGRLFGGQAHAF